MLYEKYYECPCGCTWHDTHDCLCNDRCPKCDKEIEPSSWTEVEEDPPGGFVDSMGNQY